MILKTKIENLPPDLIGPITETDQIVRSYLAGFHFLISDTRRDPTFAQNHLLSYLAQDYLQSAISILFMATEGLLNVCKRELRFILESSVKISFVQQKKYTLPVEQKLEAFDRELKSPSISLKRDLNLSMLSEPSRDAFHEEVGRLYGKTSNYVHLTPEQIIERIDAVNEGRTAGKESAAEVHELNNLLSRALACSLVLLFHAVPEYVAGDWFVENDGRSVNWHFSGSQFLADVDAYFDYKHERQRHLAEIQAARKARLRF